MGVTGYNSRGRATQPLVSVTNRYSRREHCAVSERRADEQSRIHGVRNCAQSHARAVWLMVSGQENVLSQCIRLGLLREASAALHHENRGEV